MDLGWVLACRAELKAGYLDFLKMPKNKYMINLLLYLIILSLFMVVTNN